MRLNRCVLIQIVLAASLILQGSSLLSAQLAPPVPWHGTKESPARVVRIVEGYSKEKPFKNPEGIALDRTHNEVYVADSGNHQIAVFNLQGIFLRAFVHFVERTNAQGKPGLQPGEPKSIAINSRGEIIVVDAMADYLEVLDYRGRRISKLPAADLARRDYGQSSSGSVTPIKVAVDANDTAYVALGGGRNEVVVLDKNWKVVRRIGHSGKEKGGFASITSIFVRNDGVVIVTDGSATPVQVFSPEGALLLSFGKHDMGWQNFSLPMAVVSDKAGNIWVADAIRQVISKFDAAGNYLAAVGGFGVGPGELRYPSALAGDGDKLILVIEKVGGRYQMFEVAA